MRRVDIHGGDRTVAPPSKRRRKGRGSVDRRDQRRIEKAARARHDAWRTTDPTGVDDRAAQTDEVERRTRELSRLYAAARGDHTTHNDDEPRRHAEPVEKEKPDASSSDAAEREG